MLYKVLRLWSSWISDWCKNRILVLCKVALQIIPPHQIIPIKLHFKPLENFLNNRASRVVSKFICIIGSGGHLDFFFILTKTTNSDKVNQRNNPANFACKFR